MHRTLEVSPCLPPPQLQESGKKSTGSPREGKKRTQLLDQRRNLYVLGIPQHISLEQFTGLFSSFGVISHAVILAVLDAFSRRRGFIVMSSNEEAALAMKRMSGAVVQGYKLHVSWAVVQRSNGFLDGTDRNPYSGGLCPPPSILPNISSPSYPAIQSHEQTSPASHGSSSLHLSAQMPILFLANLHPDVFRNSTDVLPLLTPYGPVRSIKLLETRPALYADDYSKDEAAKTATSIGHRLPEAPLGALIEYVHHPDALMAQKALHGQLYGSVSGPGLHASFIPSSSKRNQDTSLTSVHNLPSIFRSEQFLHKNNSIPGNSKCLYSPKSGKSFDGYTLTALIAIVPKQGDHTLREGSMRLHMNNHILDHSRHHSQLLPHPTAQRYSHSVPSSLLGYNYDSAQADASLQHRIFMSTALPASSLCTYSTSEASELYMSSESNLDQPLGVSENPRVQTPSHQFHSSPSIRNDCSFL
ncbi:hypothetical protein BS47DRAFT_438289 [Hydnum rufescens UP504]|uniref:RRM domain-containing protein n=1 Tax=Hydnum rufescens UP504 TaxID=1448309 RepID=A0A9P6AIR3_9AGAM|nr:hypothetical protein BS47DRAFT_438289 [Hydnum rufescens UP504]